VAASILAPLPALALEGSESGAQTARTGLAPLWWVVAVAVVIALLVLLAGRSPSARR
jgi:hypothetical protein